MILLAFLNVRFPDANVWMWAATLFFGPFVCGAAYCLIWHGLRKPLFLAARPNELAPVAACPNFKAPKWLYGLSSKPCFSCDSLVWCAAYRADI
jgi:hypothetical protein